MSRSTLFAVLLFAPLAASAASAADGPRYTMEKSATGYVRMDTETGEMSICEERSGQLVCKLAADERSAFQSDVERLEARVESLDARIAKLEGAPAARLDSGLPSEEEFNRTMTYMERFFRGFAGIVKELQDDEKAPAAPDGGKT